MGTGAPLVPVPSPPSNETPNSCLTSNKQAMWPRDSGEVCPEEHGREICKVGPAKSGVKFKQI